MSEARKIAIGISGGIAAYKIAELVSRLTKDGHEVHVIMTENSTRFISSLTMRTLSNNPVLLDMFEESSQYRVQHIGVAEEAELMVIAPATANVIGKIAGGIADDLLSTVVMATTAPVLVVPSMNTNMYNNPAVQQNLERLKSLGYYIMEPAEGELACGVSGRGRLPEINDIYQRVQEMLEQDHSLTDKTYLITAGATQEDLDPVRFITNRSTGKMGYALAAEAAKRGARVVLVSGPSSLPDPQGVEIHRVRSAVDMYKCCMKFFAEADVVIGAAAVADYRPLEYSELKIKKSDDDLSIKLTRNPDILAEMGKQKDRQILVGFAAETNDVIENGIAKMQKKNLDLIVANDVTAEGAGFASETNIVALVTPDGTNRHLPMMSKTEVARHIIDHIAKMQA
ncbi:MAG: bifunctional phosphopantothenoylcysteine decarboxylase/phosphopantothenate--cysteine ligase CoaBC [Acidobacteriota bacterium]